MRAGSRLSGQCSFQAMISVLVEQSMDTSRSDLACLYLHDPAAGGGEPLRLASRRGRYPAPERLKGDDPGVAFLEDSREAVVLLERAAGPFAALFLHPDMRSAVALPLCCPEAWLGALVLNSLGPRHYGRQALRFLDSYARLAGGALHASRRLRDLRAGQRRRQARDRHPSRILASLADPLLTTDREGRIRSFNPAAARDLGLSEAALGRPLEQVFAGTLPPAVLQAAGKAAQLGEERVGLRGQYTGGGRRLRFSLSISPLPSPGGHGLTLLFHGGGSERWTR